MKNYVTSALHALEARRATKQEWSRLGHAVSGSSVDTGRLDLAAELNRYANEDTSQMRHFLAAQASQTV
jgi:hypothetical protein